MHALVKQILQNVSVIITITVAMVGELGKLFKLYIATGSSHTFNKNELSAQQHN